LSARPVGEVRSVGSLIVLLMVTLGIYGLIWNFRTFEELRRYRGKGVSGGMGVLLALVGVSPFLLGSYVKEAYEETDYEPTVSAATGLWMFPGILLLGLGPIIYLMKVQGALNNLWTAAVKEGAAATPVAEPAS